MSFYARIILSILLGILATGILDYFTVFNHHLNVIIGLVVALCFYFGAPDNARRL